MIERPHQPRYPTDAAFEHGDAQGGEPIEHAAHDQPGRTYHVREREPERGRQHFESVIAFAADQPGMTMLRFEHARARMHQDRYVEPANLLVKRPEYFRVEIAVVVAAHQFDASHAEILYGAPELANRLLHVRQVN